MKKEVAVVVPIYRDQLSEFEEISLRSIVSVLGEYPLVFVKPQTLKLERVGRLFPGLSEENFADDYFKNIHAYNTLMLSPQFYERFQEYQYILIAQLDTFIFRDELHQWCAKGYDYIGAPWVVRDFYRHPFMRLCSAIKRCYCRLSGKPNSQITGNKVGNGGLSLRKVESHICATRQLNAVVDQYLSYEKHHLFNEDVFFAIEPNRHGLQFRYPELGEALQFSFDKHPAYCYKKTGGRLPFGCHAWSKKRMLKFWKNIILKSEQTEERV